MQTVGGRTCRAATRAAKRTTQNGPKRSRSQPTAARRASVTAATANSNSKRSIARLRFVRAQSVPPQCGHRAPAFTGVRPARPPYLCFVGTRRSIQWRRSAMSHGLWPMSPCPSFGLIPWRSNAFFATVSARGLVACPEEWQHCEGDDRDDAHWLRTLSP